MKLFACVVISFATQHLIAHSFSIINKTGDPKKVWRVWVTEAWLEDAARNLVRSNHFYVDVYPQNNTLKNLATFTAGSNGGYIEKIELEGVRDSDGEKNYYYTKDFQGAGGKNVAQNWNFELRKDLSIGTREG